MRAAWCQMHPRERPSFEAAQKDRRRGRPLCRQSWALERGPKLGLYKMNFSNMIFAHHRTATHALCRSREKSNRKAGRARENAET